MAFNYLHMPSTVQGTGSYAGKTITRVSSGISTYGWGKYLSAQFFKDIDNIRYTFDLNYYSSRSDSTPSAMINGDFETFVVIRIGDETTENAETLKMLQNSRFFWSNGSSASGTTILDITSISRAVTWSSAWGAYLLIFDGSLLTEEQKTTILNDPNTMNWYWVIGLLAETPVTKYTITENLTNITSDNTETEFDENTEHTITYTATGDNEITSLTSNIGTVVISSDKKTATLTFTATQNVSVTGVAGIPTFTITETLTNITSDNTETEFDENTEHTITYTATGDNEITSLTSNIGTVVISSDKKTATLTFTATQNVSVTGVAGIPTFTITETLTNIESYGSNPKTIEYGTSFVLQYTASGNYKIKTLTTNVGTVTISSDKQYATISGTATENIIVTGIAVEEFTIIITGTVENAICNYSSGDTITSESPPTITANEGYEFTGVYTYVHGSLTSQATKSADNTVLTFSNLDSNVELNDSYIATKKVEKLSTFVNLYTVTNDELTSLSKVRFLDGTDYGQYITALYIIPLMDLTKIQGDKTPIILGTKDSGVNATALKSNIYNASLYFLKVPTKYNNVYDYLNTECTLRTPFFPDITLPPEYVIGYELRLEYQLDLYNGSCRLYVYSSATDNFIYTTTENIVLTIPFIQKTSGTVVNSLSRFPYVQIATPILEVKRNIPYNVTSLEGHKMLHYTADTTIDVFLNENKANFFEIESCNIQNIPTVEELNEIKNLLQNGVYYNDPNSN